MSNNWYSAATEILTSRGFKSVSRLALSDLIAVDTLEGAKFVTPVYILQDDVEKSCVQLNRKNQADDEFGIFPETNEMWFRQRIVEGRWQYYTIPLGEWRISHSKFMLAGSLATGHNSVLTHLQRLFIATQADGSIYTTTHGKFMARYTFKKVEKTERLESILEPLTNQKLIDWELIMGDVDTFKVTGRIPILKRFDDWMNLADKSVMWCKMFLAELSNWDGHREPRGVIAFYNQNADDIDWAQAIGCISGYYVRYYISKQDAGKLPIRRVTFLPLPDTGRPSYYIAAQRKIKQPWFNIVTNVPQQRGLILRNNHIIFVG